MLRPRRARARALRALVGVALLLLAALLLWRPLARAAAHALIVEDSLRPAAAIVVLQGGPVFRDSDAAALYHAGLAPRIIISRDEPPPFIPAAHALGIAYPTNHEVSVQTLRKLGVPDGAVVTLDRAVRSTAEELAQVFAFVGPGDSPIIMVTSPLHTRRSLLLWNRTARGARPALLSPARSDRIHPDSWWHYPSETLALVREYLGLLRLAVDTPTS